MYDIDRRDNAPSRPTHGFFYFILQCFLPFSLCVMCDINPGRDEILCKGHRKIDLGLKVVQFNCIICLSSHVSLIFERVNFMHHWCGHNFSHVLTISDNAVFEKIRWTWWTWIWRAVSPEANSPSSRLAWWLWRWAGRWNAVSLYCAVKTP